MKMFICAVDGMQRETIRVVTVKCEAALVQEGQILEWKDFAKILFEKAFMHALIRTSL